MRKFFYEDVKNIINSNEDYELLTDEDGYVNSNTKIRIFHKKCMCEYITDFKTFNRGSRCSHCFGTHKKTVNEFNQEMQQKGIRYICKEYNGALSKSLMYDPECKKEFLMKPNDILCGHGCPYCNGTPKHTVDYIKNKIEIIDPDYTLTSTEYNGNKEPITVLHKLCGTEFETTYNAFSTANRRCPECAKRSINSSEEKTLLNFIKSIYHGEIIQNYRVEGFNSYELDIFIPELNVGIEYDGIYWHSSEFKNKKYHLDKTAFYRRRGIRVVHVFSDEWNDKRSIVESKIMNILKVSQNKIYARQCSVVEISYYEKERFLESYHIQGNDKARYYLALKYRDEIVAVMTLCKLRVALGNKNAGEDVYELSRFATSTNVVGGFSKLLKHITNEYGIKSLVTYADLRYSDLDSNVYIRNGFKLDHVSQPNYFYIKNGKRIHRFNFMKSRLKKLFPEIYSDSKTEIQITEEAGYRRIYDCGNAVFIKNC